MADDGEEFEFEYTKWVTIVPITSSCESPMIHPSITEFIHNNACFIF
ncbi:hypothetical protein TYRP_008293 [Tyrophagus putrescentiae]|nr:hypothetical protein TYRP_008293 [Tyrophagus putrescentiae]